jgi:hypothetical protein
MLFKVNTFGERAFLDSLNGVIARFGVAKQIKTPARHRLVRRAGVFNMSVQSQLSHFSHHLQHIPFIKVILFAAPSLLSPRREMSSALSPAGIEQIILSAVAEDACRVCAFVVLNA